VVPDRPHHQLPRDRDQHLRRPGHRRDRRRPRQDPGAGHDPLAHLQEGRSAIPQVGAAERIAENFDVFDFELTTAELKVLDTLDTGVRGGPEPDQITLENFGRPIPEA
jgi:hypothetical protein